MQLCSHSLSSTFSWSTKKKLRKNAIECGIPFYCCRETSGVFRDRFIDRTDVHIFKIYIFSKSIFVPLFVVVIFKDHFLTCT